MLTAHSSCLMSIILLLIIANAVTPATNTGPATHVYRKQATAKVQIVELEKVSPVDRAAARKSHDRSVRRRGDIILVEFF
jgi:hypothetical protein